MDSYCQKFFNFYFGAAIFQKYFAFCFNVDYWQNLIGIHGSNIESSCIRKNEAKCRYNMFSENLMVFMDLKQSFSKFKLNSCFAFNC